MVVVQVRLPEELQEVVKRQVAEGRAADLDAFMAEAAWRYAEDLELEDDLIAEARAGIADIEAGRYTTIVTREDLAAKEADVITRVRNRLAADKD